MENKHRLKLSNKYSEYLENKPEKGMGYQVVDIELNDGRKIKNRIVLNSTYLELNFENEFWNKDIKELKISEN
jgi:hypothetical protein